MARAGGHVLIIEDEMLVAMEVEDHLLNLGFETFDFALTPKEAIALACARRPDLVTADFRIQGGTGVDAVDGILAAIGEVPVIFVTGNRTSIPATYADVVVEKPFTARALRSACDVAFGC